MKIPYYICNIIIVYFFKKDKGSIEHVFVGAYELIIYNVKINVSIHVNTIYILIDLQFLDLFDETN